MSQSAVLCPPVSEIQFTGHRLGEESLCVPAGIVSQSSVNYQELGAMDKESNSC